jgi:Uncharacterized conserved protein
MPRTNYAIRSAGIQFYVQKRSSMQPEDRDAAYRWGMLDYAHTILKFTSRLNYTSYLMDRKLQLAVERRIEIIGESAKMSRRHLRKNIPKFRGI